MDQKPSGWSIKSFYKEAWQLVKTQKVLWLFGIAAGASTSFNVRGSNIFDADRFEKLFQSTPHGGDSVLGSSTSVVFDNLSYLFSAVPLWTYVVLVLEAVILFLIVIGIAIVFQNWATASLLHGISDAIHKRAVSIKTSSERAFANIVPLIRVTVVPYFLLGAFSLLVFVLLFLGISIADSTTKSLFGFLLTIGVLAFAIAVLLLTMTLIWAVRFVAIDNTSPKTALSQGFALTKAHFWRMLGLGIVNLLGSMLVFVIPVAILIGIIALGIISLDANKAFGSSLLMIGGTLVAIFILAIQLLSGVLTAFKATVWTLAYHIVHKKHD